MRFVLDRLVRIFFLLKQYNFLFPTLKSSLKAKTQHISNNVLNFIEHYTFIFTQQHRPNYKRGQKVILLCKKCKTLRFYHSLKVQVVHKYTFEIKSKEET